MLAMIFLAVKAIKEKAKERPQGYLEDVIASGTPITGDSGELEFVAITHTAFDRLIAKYSPDIKTVHESSTAAARGGPGTELKKLLATVGITATPNCPCNARAVQMDENESREPGWCESNIDTIVGWLREEAEKRGLPFLDIAGRLLVKRAIRNARRAAAS